MDLIIHKLLDDVLTLLADFWQALWYGDQASSGTVSTDAALKRGTTGSTRPTV